MKAKDRHKLTMLKYLADPDNAFPSRVQLAEVVGINRTTFYKYFPPDELTEIERQGLELRRKKYAKKIAVIDEALMREAEEGNAQAIKLVYQRFEGWSEKNQTEISGPNGGPIEAVFNVEFIK